MEKEEKEEREEEKEERKKEEKEQEETRELGPATVQPRPSLRSVCGMPLARDLGANMCFCHSQSSNKERNLKEASRMMDMTREVADLLAQIPFASPIKKHQLTEVTRLEASKTTGRVALYLFFALLRCPSRAG